MSQTASRNADLQDAGSVLFVDDERAVRLAGQQALELAGFDVTACDGAERALRHLGRDWPGCLVTDVRMPQMDGLSLLAKVRDLDPDLPVIVITGHGDVPMAVEAMRNGAYDFLEKPFPSDRLTETARRAVEKRRLVMENRRLRAQLAGGVDPAGTIVGRTAGIERLRATISAVADTDADVLVFGETGTGKEMVARALHAASGRRKNPFVALNCGAMPEAIFESELFGHEAGAFTGAAKRRIGRIEHAGGGTLFLDEIESMPMHLQVKLLRVIQERVVEPLGSNEQVPVDLRVVAATKADLRQAADAGRFRADLYYRLNVVVLTIPPLRERRDDIPLLFQHFVLQAASRYNREPRTPSRDQLQRLMGQDWPGNVRELRNAADRFVLGLEEAAPAAEPAAAALSLAEQVDLFEKGLIQSELARHRGSVKATIEALSVPRKTFYDKLKRYGLSREDFVE
ncbi:sigma-54-dependent transcriptional regulator [Azospirillum picis]|uniref:Two-component system C4-dicarboxylate transport response regulator DctD n=1 Tax=Azospirillum picis TaxID=488438 RepID=A0ABU0MH06_9PROT|nr:sigma-54 dependent transcriptional regulator [Azospirillum picis]MBP2299055.1 two-component system C4-dicarboxylate transport response regulator DctD [Azospirillum picis]MDQ0532703.1 two-component system C4-dicarboxylate transport response regulator DctD [Azospirillum picis]